MRSRTPLALMEQAVMLLVFSLAAALCLQIFVFSDRLSRQNEMTDHAVTVCQNAVEILKASSGDLSSAAAILGGSVSQDRWSVYYDQHWQESSADAAHAFCLTVQRIPSPVAGLAKAEIQVCRETGEPLFSLTTAWQEVDGNA